MWEQIPPLGFVVIVLVIVFEKAKPLHGPPITPWNRTVSEALEHEHDHEHEQS